MPPIPRKIRVGSVPQTNGEAPKPTQITERKERLAISLVDIDRIPSEVRQIMLGGKLDATKAIKIDKTKLDEIGVLFTCDLLTAGTISDLIRGHDKKLGDYPTRVYIQRAIAWERLPADTLLTIVKDGRVILNPKVFPDKLIEVDAAPAVPMKPKPLF